MISSQQIELVNTPQTLQHIKKELESIDIVGLDTEFHAENRYFPKLMLLQIASQDGRAWLIDPLAIDIRSLGPAMKHLKLITHGGQEDVRLLAHHLQLQPQKIFDTQIAAAFMGKHYPLALNSLIEEELRKQTPKETLSDWSRRPLSKKQIFYAAEDATQLLSLYAVFQRKIDPQYIKWIWYASQEMANNVLAPPALGMDWMDWGIAEILEPVAQRVLTRLLFWREKTGREKDKPANYILPRGIALDLARRRPHRRKELLANRRINHGLVNRHGDQLLQCIHRGEKDKLEFLLPSKQERLIASLIQSWAIAQEKDIHPDLLMPKELALDLAIHGISACNGWRQEAIGAELSLFLQGKSGIYLQNKKPSIQRFS